MHIIVDQRTTVAPSGTYTRSTLNTFLENGKVKSYTGNRPFSVYFKPAVAQTVGNVSGAGFLYAPWLQTSQTALTHYGFHAFAQDFNMNGSFGQAFDVFVKFYIQCKGLK